MAAFTIAFIYFYFIPDFIRFIWPKFCALGPGILLYYLENILYVVALYFTNLTALITGNFIMMIVYKLKIPFIESYRISQVNFYVIQKAWPWEENY